MNGLKFLLRRYEEGFSFTHIVCSQLRKIQHINFGAFSKSKINEKVEETKKNLVAPADPHWPRKIFSGIKPSGGLHLGNYLGVVQKWTKLQNTTDVTYCLVDMHSVTLPQESTILRENIFKLAATLLACGINPNRAIIFAQSAVKEHSELCWLLGTLCTMTRLRNLPEFKEKTLKLREIPLGLFVYSIMQSSDILLYKATHVPVGEDQVQHIQLAQHLAELFNTRFGPTFPICQPMIDDKQVSCIRSLRDPTKKMSKSDPDPKSVIYITDEPDVVVEKVKKAVTDFCSEINFDWNKRPGVSNLITIHSHITGQPIEQIISEAETLDTGEYKLRVAEAINEHLKPIQKKIAEHLENRDDLIHILDNGAKKARNIALETMEEVKHKMGLGATPLHLYDDVKKPVIKQKCKMMLGHKPIKVELSTSLR